MPLSSFSEVTQDNLQKIFLLYNIKDVVCIVHVVLLHTANYLPACAGRLLTTNHHGRAEKTYVQIANSFAKTSKSESETFRHFYLSAM